MHAQTRRFQHCAQEGERRSLTVGAGDMDHRRQLAFGMIERRQQPLNALKPVGTSTCPQCQEAKLPHAVCGNCGYYRGRQARPVPEE